MNSLEKDLHRPDPAFWAEQEVREMLAVRDIAALYQYLRRYGFSQNHIARLTGQSQPEVSAITRGLRRVQSFDVLLRIADGLGIPRELLVAGC
jgi:hypothetical protein